MVNALSSLLPPATNGINSSNFSPPQGNSGFEDLLASLTDNSTVKKADGKTDKDKTDNILNFIQQVLASIDNSLESIGSSSATTAGKSTPNTNPVDASNTAAFESILASGGPLPTFLHEVDVRMHLNPTQQQALQDIATENMNVTKTPETVQKIAMELQQARIY